MLCVYCQGSGRCGPDGSLSCNFCDGSGEGRDSEAFFSVDAERARQEAKKLKADISKTEKSNFSS